MIIAFPGRIGRIVEIIIPEAAIAVKRNKAGIVLSLTSILNLTMGVISCIIAIYNAITETSVPREK